MTRELSTCGTTLALFWLILFSMHRNRVFVRI